jgi:hypothetical protein
VPTFEKHPRSFGWYVVFAIIGIALLIYAVVSVNYLFAFIIVLFAFIVYVQKHSEPELVDFTITSKGIVIGKNAYPYKDIKTFWILYDPPVVKKLYFCFKRAVAPRIMVPLQDQNPLHIRDFLLQFLEEDLGQEEEPISEIFGRLAKM